MSDTTSYEPPKIWTWDAESGGKWASINRPISGATREAELPRGKHPLQLYSLATPNGQKVTILLEELLEMLKKSPPVRGGLFRWCVGLRPCAIGRSGGRPLAASVAATAPANPR